MSVLSSRREKRWALIGHRGTGKSSLLGRIERAFADSDRVALFFDLDAEIEKRQGKKVSELFANGEAAFRTIERETFAAIIEETKSQEIDVFIACGAGLDVTTIPETWTVQWVRRTTDARGRIFMDRPRLDPRLPALSEFNERYPRRQAAYGARADEVLWLDEGADSFDAVEAGYFLGTWRNLGGAITVLPQRFRTPETFAAWVARRLRWGVRWFELRDDLLSLEQIEEAVRLLPDEKILVSFRRESRTDDTRALVERGALPFDWPIEHGDCEWGTPHFLSLHQRLAGQSIEDALSRFPTELPEGTQAKAALPIDTFAELSQAHAWRENSPEERVFLPLSLDGRWSWYRLQFPSPTELCFFREDEGSGADQPRLIEWARRASRGRVDSPSFAAVLGDPVSHSRTPLEQGPYFAPSLVHAIRVSDSDWNQGALEVLRALGLGWAAVTAPLKKLAFETCKDLDPVARELASVNTLVWSESSSAWRGANTDLEGFRRAIAEVEREFGSLGRVAIWGGGGTLAVIRAVCPGAEAFSARSGENRDSLRGKAEDFVPETVIWAAGRGTDESQEPPGSWKPKLVVDLDYADDSMGRAFALARGCRYKSGLSMFKHQARAQRDYWTQARGN